MLNRIYTIGHSTRALAELVGLLRDHGVTRLADIRRSSAAASKFSTSSDPAPPSRTS